MPSSKRGRGSGSTNNPPLRARGRVSAGRGIGLLLGALPIVALAKPPPAFEDPAPSTSHNGAVQVQWSGGRGEYEVQLRHGEHVRSAYRGPMASAHLSGLVDGEYALQVRARTEDGGWTAWSAPKRVTVEHHPMSLVWVLMSLGLLTFAATAVVVVRSSTAASGAAGAS